jgi:hypothetical protein
MKKIFFCSIFFCFAIAGNTQTKAETIDWILGKFRKWKIVDTRIGYTELGTVSGGTSEIPKSLVFNSCNMIFKSEYNYILSSSSFEEITYSFNFGDVDNIQWIHAHNIDLLVISTIGKQVKQVSITKSNYAFEKSKQEEPTIKYIDRCIIAFDTDGEDDFKARMIKALRHFQSFCPASKKIKEAF